MFDPSSGGHLALDPSSIAGFAHGQTIYLPSNLRNRFMTGLLNTISVNNERASSVVADPKTPFTFRNEEFTALGNVGHLVRVPNSRTTDSSNTPPSTEFSSLTGTKVTINGNPIEIIGVADMSQLDPSGNPHFFSFNPGSGSAAEIQALQSALLGNAVDMSNFVPPPYLADGSHNFATDPSGSPVVTSNTVTTVETLNEHTTLNNSREASSASASSSAIKKQLDRLLSQGHSQANTQTDITAIMGQIDSAINDINRRSNITSEPAINDVHSVNRGMSSLDSSFNFDMAAAETTTTVPDFAFGIDSVQSGIDSFTTNTDVNAGRSVMDNTFRELGSGRFTGTMSNTQFDSSTLFNDFQSGADTRLGNSTFNVVNKAIAVDMQTSSEPHASDIKTGGMFPLEGNMAARYAAISDITNRLTKLDEKLGLSSNDIMKTDSLGAEGTKISLSSTNSKSGGITFTPGTKASDGGTGIFAISSSLGNMLKGQNLMTGSSISDVLSSSSDIAVTDSSSVPISLDSFAQRRETKNKDSVSFLGNKRVLGNVNRADSFGIANTNIENIDNSQTSIGTRNVLNVGMGTLSNIINASSNKIFANSRITNNGISANIADAASVPLTGSNGGPITNMVGIQTNDNNAVLSQSQASIDNSVPSGSFVVGAGQPNPTVIRTGKPESTESSFSLSSRPGTMGTFSIGSVNTGMHDTSSTADFGFNTADLASEMGSDPNTTVVHTVTTVEITSMETVNETSNSAAASVADQSLSAMDSTLNTIDPGHFDPYPDIAFAVGNGKTTGETNVFNQMSLPDAALQTKTDTVATVQNEILTGQKHFDTGAFVSPTVDNPQASPLIMDPHVLDPGTDTLTVHPSVSPIVAQPGSSSSKQTMSSAAKSARVSIGSGLSILQNQDAPGLPAKKTDKTKVVDSATSEPPAETRAKALPSQWSATGSSFSMDGLAVGQHSKPIVGNIFGSGSESSSKKLTQRFLEQSGITKRPAMDFMTTFLNQDSKPSSNGQNVQIVPLRSDNMMRRSPTNMFVVGTGARKSDPLVDKFGVADITTRSRQLNRNQWSNFVSSRAQDNDFQTKYQTQNLIGSSETRPLNGNDQTSITTDFGTTQGTLSNKGSGASTQTSTIKTKRSKNAGLTVFEAPGMSGRNAVSVSAFSNRMTASPTTTVTAERRTFETRVNSVKNTPLANTVGVTDTQRSSAALAGAQATALKTSEFANSFQRTLKSSGTPVAGPNFINQDGNIDAANTVLSTGQGADRGILSTSSFSAQSALEAAGNNFNVGDSLMISDTSNRPGLEGPISTTNIERMRFGKPVVLNKVTNTTVTQTTGNVISPDVSGLLLNQNLDIAATRRGTLTAVSNTPVMDAPLQNGQVQATRFTSGNRFAVFGPANDVSGRSFRAKATSRQATGMRIGVLAPVAECRYQPDPSSSYHFIYKNGVTQHRLRCALGTAFDEMTCECSIRVSDHGKCNKYFVNNLERKLITVSFNNNSCFIIYLFNVVKPHLSRFILV